IILLILAGEFWGLIFKPAPPAAVPADHAVIKADMERVDTAKMKWITLNNLTVRNGDSVRLTMRVLDNTFIYALMRCTSSIAAQLVFPQSVGADVSYTKGST